MRVTILAIGSRGDVQPMLALGLALGARGHEVRVAALDPFAELVRERGLDFASLGPLPAGFTRRIGPLRVPEFTGVIGRALFWAVYGRLLERRLAALAGASEGADALVFGGLAFPAAFLAEARNIPCYWASPTPHTATAEFADPFFAEGRWASATAAIRRRTYGIEASLRSLGCAGVLARLRRALGLPTVPIHRLAGHLEETLTGVLYAASRHLLERPREWPEKVQITGAFDLPPAPGWTPPPAIAAFLAAGPRPIYVGFGTMNERDPARLGRLALDALARVGGRGILGGLGLTGAALPPWALAVDDVPHAWLFEEIALAVHHGGAGTCAAAARAGIPSVVAPQAYDQFFWAERMHRRGVAGPPLPHRELRAERLAAAIRAGLESGPQRAAARALRAAVLAEDGATTAASTIARDLRRGSASVQEALP
ncbi:MAG: glycosyltransferase [Nannocystaceae bacterium]